jgi:lipopolysaccharide transport system ATP-binding protein
MSDAIIKAEGLGKKYTLSHQRKESYYALRDVMADAVKRWGNKMLHPLSSRRGPDPTHEEFWALKDISFEINQGDRVGIIGRNGAGKSTLLKILSRITESTEGRVTLRGRVASLLEVGTGFHPELTGRENIYLNGAILGMTKAEIKKKFDEIVAFAEVERFLDTPVKRYSSGMYVRLAFAVAAHLEPEILVVDEVLAVGDAQFQKKCLGKMEDVSREGRTVLFVSHNMAAINRLCQRVLWLDKGQTRDFGDSETICQRYLFDNQNMSGMHEFTTDKDYTIEFLRAETIDSQGKTASIFRADEEIRFRIIYRVNADISGSTVVLNICTAEAQSLWAVSDIDMFPDLYEMRKKGVWVYECIAPAKILRPGRFLAALGSAGGHGQYFHHPELFAFEITTQGYWRESHKYFGLGGGPVSAPMRMERPVAIVDNKGAGVNV